ncbi:MAG: trypsin-like peptidase domain-containing protein [Tenericutes bacterium]|nr:trypsin-like peptidase domain-containing protein [Mycoplasmatota bacterium]
MKKIILSLSLLVVTFGFVGCNIGTFTDEPTTTATSTEAPTTYTTTIPAITSTTLDENMIISEIYNLIYEDLYDEIKAEVIENISQERFDQIYQQVLSDLRSDIESGSITLTAETVVEMILNIEQNSANSVVGIIAYDATGAGLQTGSGVVYKHVGDKYYVVTNEHVVRDGISIDIYFEDGSTISANLIGVDDLVDVAVLSFISSETYEVSNFADSSQVAKGDIILAVGHPQGFDFYGSITMGIVSGLDRYFDIDGDDINDMFVNYIQHDAAINSGNSGGALFDIYGDVIGLNVIKISATDVEGMGFAIPSNLVAAICSDIEVYGVSLQKPVLGINFLELRGHIDYLVNTIGASIPNGVTDGFYIYSVVAGASFDGYVEAEDIIVRIGDVDLTTAEDFVLYFSKYLVGDTISISLYRNGTLLTFEDIELKAKVDD